MLVRLVGEVFAPPRSPSEVASRPVAQSAGYERCAIRRRTSASGIRMAASTTVMFVGQRFGSVAAEGCWVAPWPGDGPAHQERRRPGSQAGVRIDVTRWSRACEWPDPNYAQASLAGLKKAKLMQLQHQAASGSGVDE